MFISGTALSHSQFGTSSYPVQEYDVTMATAGATFDKTAFDALIAGKDNFRYINIQCQVDDTTAAFVAKVGLTDGYNLASGRGRVLTRLSEVTLDRTKLEFLNIISLVDAVYLHITVFG